MKLDGLYVHVPFCDGKCGYCAFYSTLYRPRLADRFLNALATEAAQLKTRFPGFSPSTVYIGGGTPTVFDESQFARLLAIVGSLTDKSRIEEYTIEANPASVSDDKLEHALKCGVDRISIGAQSFDDDLLKLLGRRHKAADISAAAEMARECGFENVGLDLICGIPGLTAETWADTLDKALGLEPEHVSVYDLTPEEGTELCDEVSCGAIDLPDDDEELALLAQAEKTLTGAGFRRYEISNYALPEFECAHNVACWRGAEYLGIGPAAASHMSARRWANVGDLTLYLAALEDGNPPPCDVEELSPHTRAMELIMLGLRTAEGVALPMVAAAAGVSSAEEKKWVAVFERLEESRLITRREGRWALTSRGRNLADAVTSDLISQLEIRSDGRTATK